MRTASSSPGSESPPDWAGRALLGAALLLALGGGARLVSARTPAAPAVQAAAPVACAKAPAPPSPREEVAATAAVEPAALPLPASLRDSEEDGQLREDEAGNLLVGPEVLRLFDHYLSATGEERPEVIRARIAAAIHRRLPGARAAEQAMALLDTYLDYREATRRLRPTGDDPEARLDALRTLPRRSFGASTAEQLFGEEERALGVALEQRRILADPGLSAEERGAQLSEAEGRLPEPTRAARAEATLPLRAREEEETMRAAGASAEDLRAYRTATFGPEAASRLAELDERRAAWQRRLAAFREARAAVERAEPEAARRRAAIQALLDASFPPAEQIRVDALDRQEQP